MKIKFKASAVSLNEALAIVAIVTPRPFTPQGGSGFLFVARGTRCYVYSRDAQRVARADFEIEPIEGEGAFIYPYENIGLLGSAGDGEITFTATSEGDTHKVGFTSSSGAKDTRTTYDARLLTPCDKDVEGATDEKVFPVGLLKEALRQAKPFLADDKKANDQEHLKTIQILDASKPEWAKGNGVLYAANGTKAFFFQSDAFVDKGFAIRGEHLGALMSFLGQTEGEVKVRKSRDKTFISNDKGHVLGWNQHEKMHGKFVYYTLSNDTYVIDVPVSAAISALRYMQAGLSSLKEKKDKIRFVYEVEPDPRITFVAVEGNSETTSFPVPVIPHEGSKAEGISFFVNLGDLTSILSDAKGDRLMLRLAILPKNEQRPKDAAMLRTIDTYWADKDGKVLPGNEESKPEGAYQCRVTRFVPGVT